MMSFKKVKKLAIKLNECFEHKTFDKGTDKERTITTIKDDTRSGSVNTIPEDLHDLCVKLVYSNDKAGDDYTYKWTWTALDIIANGEDEDEVQNIFNEQEASIYTNDLTAWLHSRCDRIYWLTQALTEFDVKDGFMALTYAQSLEMQDVFNDVLSQLQEVAK